METQRDFTKPVEKSKKKIVFFLLFVIFNVGVIGYTAVHEFSQERPPSLHIEFGWLNAVYIICAFGCIAVAMFAETVKYLMMMSALGVKRSVRVALQTSILGKYYDSITPSGAGGQPSQIWFMHRNGYDAGTSAAMPLSAFFTMQMSFVIIAVVLFISNGRVLNSQPGIKITAWLGLIFYLAFPLMILLTALAPKIAAKIVNVFVDILAKIRIFKNPEKKKETVKATLADYSNGIKTIAKERFLLIKLFICSGIFQVAICSIPYFVLLAFGGHLPYFEVLTLTFFIYAAITFIPTPGNSGAAEASFYLVFGSLSSGGVFWAMLSWRFVCYYTFIFLGLGVYAYNAVKNRKKAKKIGAGIENVN